MKQLNEQATIDPSASVTQCRLGAWTEIDARVSLAESELGDYSYVMHDSDIIYCSIGKFTNIASFVRINPGNHPMQRASQHHFMYRSSLYDMGDDDEAFFDWRRSFHCSVGHDVWLGHACTIMAGVRIGHGAVVGAGSVVTHDVPDYAIAVGAPTRIIRQRHPEPIQQSLLRIRWWDWSHQQICERLDDFRHLNIEQFCRQYDDEFIPLNAATADGQD